MHDTMHDTMSNMYYVYILRIILCITINMYNTMYGMYTMYNTATCFLRVCSLKVL